VACACPNNGVTLATAGFVMTDLFEKVRCGLPTSNADGTLGMVAISDDFAVLGH
jgi:hypothetical protein